MKYKIVYSKKAEYFIEKLDSKDQKIIVKKIDSLQENPELGKPLRHDLKKYRRLRVLKYRILYEIKNNELLVYVVKIDKRKIVYQ